MQKRRSEASTMEPGIRIRLVRQGMRPRKILAEIERAGMGLSGWKDNKGNSMRGSGKTIRNGLAEERFGIYSGQDESDRMQWYQHKRVKYLPHGGLR